MFATICRDLFSAKNLPFSSGNSECVVRNHFYFLEKTRRTTRWEILPSTLQKYARRILAFSRICLCTILRMIGTFKRTTIWQYKFASSNFHKALPKGVGRWMSPNLKVASAFCTFSYNLKYIVLFRNASMAPSPPTTPHPLFPVQQVNSSSSSTSSSSSWSRSLPPPTSCSAALRLQCPQSL